MARSLLITLSLIAVIIAYVVAACILYAYDEPRFEEVGFTITDVRSERGRIYSTRVSRQCFVTFRLDCLGWDTGKRMGAHVEPCFRPMAHVLRKWKGHPRLVSFRSKQCDDTGVRFCRAGEEEWTVIAY